ncbi:MAG: Na/Pi cotransporter family protein [Sedimentisphaerales bacterium]|jgi:phosphate:Na+ symporter|nr:Na/Pi cotransporter family protein [Sedimentisphaerales bacterium]HNY77085.1 Na/Pi cotransporter family protein [Sedimentisphaerales bacterium]HOC62499.1 Na/Pi cotransporter family protein [Sedimentisphaerales bacterium]HOH63017.1 Na/Pi cotransporter family protein [Sedimentisphaerales bacterium]HPY50570.1 Na/Pi cotransporter family protein [Sedimentisphaerales bacterium]
MIKDMIFYTVGGLGLFLFGMKLMSDGLRAAAGRKLRSILESMTKKPMVAFLIGAAVTAIVQSSSATSVMVIGFVNAGLLTLKQAICVIIGTNVGTTATAWLVSISGIGALNITAYALPAVGLGFLMSMSGRSRKMRNLGQILLGFGLLFVGIGFMKDAFEPLERSPWVHELFVTLGHQPILAILAGTVVTMLIQSSSAAIAIVQLLAIGGAFGSDWNVALNIAIPFVLGSNIGTTITAQLAAIQGNVSARRAAWAHTVFNVAGVAMGYPLVHWGWFGMFVVAICPWPLGPATIAMSIAVAHTLFKLADAAIWLPLAGVLERVVVRLVRERPGDAVMRPIMLEKHLLDTPEIALEQTKREIVRMAKTAKRALRASINGIVENDVRALSVVREIEDFVDSFQLEITSYLSALSSRHLSDEVSIELPVLLHTVNDLERIGDHAVNIVEIAERKIDQKFMFSESALAEAERLKREVEQMFDYIIAALQDSDVEQAKAALTNEKNLNRMQIEFRRSHVDRMRDGLCTPESGLIFIDLVDNVEKIGDHLTNIAQAVIGGLQWEGVKPRTKGLTGSAEDESVALN